MNLLFIILMLMLGCGWVYVVVLLLQICNQHWSYKEKAQPKLKSDEPATMSR